MKAMMIGATCAPLLVSVAVFAQDKPLRVRGTIEQSDGGMMTVKSREGDTLKIKLADKQGCRPGEGVTRRHQAEFLRRIDGDAAAGRYLEGRRGSHFPEEIHGTGEGDRPTDNKPQSTMTNGTVDHMGKSTTTGTVANEEGTTLTLNYKDGSKKIVSRLRP